MKNADFNKDMVLTEPNPNRKPNILHHLDDFLFAGKAHSHLCQKALAIFQNICQDLMVPKTKQNYNSSHNHHIPTLYTTWKSHPQIYSSSKWHAQFCLSSSSILESLLQKAVRVHNGHHRIRLPAEIKHMNFIYGSSF